MYARAMRREVINAHLLGILPQLVDRGTGITPAATFRPSLPWSTGISFTSPHRGSSSAVPRPHVERALCRRGARNGFVPRTSCARQPVRGARPEAGWAAASVDLAGAVMCDASYGACRSYDVRRSS